MQGVFRMAWSKTSMKDPNRSPIFQAKFHVWPTRRLPFLDILHCLKKQVNRVVRRFFSSPINLEYQEYNHLPKITSTHCKKTPSVTRLQNIHCQMGQNTSNFTEITSHINWATNCIWKQNRHRSQLYLLVAYQNLLPKQSQL